MNKGRPDPPHAPGDTPPLSRVDLHSHSFFSDGDHSPGQVAAMAQEAGLAALALTDHDCVDGFPGFRDAARDFEPVCGVEISSRREGKDVHVLGLFINPDHPGLRRELATLATERVERLRRIIGRLQALQIPITEEEVWVLAGTGTVGRPHVALALVERGIVGSVEEAFRRFLRPDRPAYVPSPGPAPEVAIAWIHEAGGAAVLAHPALIRNDAVIPVLAEAGLDGIEVWHPKQNAGQRRAYLEWARRLSLVPSGGSDYHGARVGDARIGQEPVPLESLEHLRARRR